MWDTVRRRRPSVLHRAASIRKMIIYHTIEVALLSYVRKGGRSCRLRDLIMGVFLWVGRDETVLIWYTVGKRTIHNLV